MFSSIYISYLSVIFKYDRVEPAHRSLGGRCQWTDGAAAVLTGSSGVENKINKGLQRADHETRGVAEGCAGVNSTKLTFY